MYIISICCGIKPLQKKGNTMSKTFAFSYLRTSSAANVGADKDSDKRQRAAIYAYAASAGYEIVD